MELIDIIKSFPARISNVIIIIIYAIFLCYILDLESKGCTCSTDWKRDYIKNFSILVLVFYGLEVVKPGLLLNSRLSAFLLTFFGLLFMFSTVKFISELRNKNCNCSKNWKRSFMETYMYVAISILGLGFFFHLTRLIYTRKTI